MLLLLLPAFAWGRGRLGPTDVLVGLTFAHLALASARHIPLFAVAAAPLLADGLQAAAGAASPRSGRSSGPRRRRSRSSPSASWSVSRPPGPASSTRSGTRSSR